MSRALDELGAALRQRPSVRDEVMRRVTEQAARGGAPSAASGRRGRRVLGRLGAVAACAAVALLVWSPWGGGPRSGEAFAAAIANVQRARTFSCRQVVTKPAGNGGPRVQETLFMFKEPDLERIEYGGDLPAQVTVTDYGKQVRLVAHPAEKTASVDDISTMYTTDGATGRLKPAELHTDVRDHLIRISDRAVRALGRDELDGREVWAFQSADGAEPRATVWLDPADGTPVRIELSWPAEGRTFTYSDIAIDEPLDDALFSVEPPAGYAVRDRPGEWVSPADEINGKMMAKMMRLLRECYTYMNENEGRWPQRLEDLLTAGVDAETLQTLLSAPDAGDGKPVILYQRPKDGESEVRIVVYESPEFRRKEGVVCGFSDGHAELLNHATFEEMMKRQAAAE